MFSLDFTHRNHMHKGFEMKQPKSPLSNIQQELLQLFSHQLTESELSEVKELLASYMKKAKHAHDQTLKESTVEYLTSSTLKSNIAKQQISSLLNALPDDCTLEDIQYHLYVIEKVQRGLNSADTAGGISQEEAEKRLEKWLK